MRMSGCVFKRLLLRESSALPFPPTPVMPTLASEKKNLCAAGMYLVVTLLMCPHVISYSMVAK